MCEMKLKFVFNGLLFKWPSCLLSPDGMLEIWFYCPKKNYGNATFHIVEEGSCLHVNGSTFVGGLEKSI